MRFLYLAIVIMLLVATAMADPACKGQRTCRSLGGTCAKSCKAYGSSYSTYYTCDCARQGLQCCVPHKKG